MIFSKFIFVFMILAGQFSSACESSEESLKKIEDELVEKILTRFSQLTAQTFLTRCGNSSIEFSFKPQENLVPINSQYKSWNKEFRLGTIHGKSHEERLRTLSAILNLSDGQMNSMIQAKTAYVQDSYELENKYGISTYPTRDYTLKQRVNEFGGFQFVSMPHCFAEHSWKTERPGWIDVPIHDLEMTEFIGKVPLYRKGDLEKAFVNSEEDRLLDNMTFIAKENAEYRSSGCLRASLDRGFVNLKGVVTFVENLLSERNGNGKDN